MNSAMTINTTSTARVVAAIARTREVLPAHWEACLAQRSKGSPTAAGSVYDLAPVEIEAALLDEPWEPFAHESVAPGCSAFAASIPGWVGLVLLGLCGESAEVTLTDPKGTGFVEATVKGQRRVYVTGTVIILGDHAGSEVVFTFHPGAPIAPSRLPAEGNVGRVITAGEAARLGLRWAKVAQ